jgi:carbon storage regulator
MLILVRKVQQGIWIEGGIWVKVLSVERDRVKLGISAPGDVKVMRQELFAEAAEPGALPPGSPHAGGANGNGNGSPADILPS